MASSKRGNVWLGASGLVINSNGEWLVVKKRYSALKGMWSFPAGFVDAGETVDMAAIREVKEETGIDCRIEGLIGFRTGVIQGEISDNMAIFLLSALDEKQQLIPQLEEISEVAWRSPFALKEDRYTSIMLKEMAETIIEKGLPEIVDINPGDRFGYTTYKLFFDK
ncbi:NUDIX domain-containing protein [Sporosarcina pasteurii]|uniref:Nucleoside triphosphate pyrophosphohydrolase n=1 Tax=Sporosarcina pasteurii TaxID=1474 RepID=A0A380CAU1_SPOPA|nr:NUDIX hydrolase [Sporosarcina pasteurii]MDS9472782.1 NUDIX hydrolase [Sporosarcina pasteurii]QBQ04433.1 NUDIX hydrolase [Sporosarcina pasteurii]SUJ15092.1 nucleoside triphosphate pyrophosphohydrolase [Sporosarcina pasteurii]